MAGPDEPRIREKAYHLWVSQGRPEGRADENWAMARELVAIEDSQMSTTHKPPSRPGEPVEPAIAFENQGEFPTLTDEGEAQPGPTRQAEAANANVLPEAPPRERASDKGQGKGKSKGKGKDKAKKAGGEKGKPKSK